jgi:signal transduction histidine kinase
MVVSGGDTLGSLQLLLEEKAVYDRSIYPHLLLGPAQQAPNYDIMYALYKDGNLVLGHGDLPYPRAVSSPATLVQSLPQGFDYEVLNPGNGLVLLGAAPAKGIMGILGGIGVFFFLIGSVGQLGHLLRNLYMALRRPKAYWNGLSLQNRISLVTTSSVFIMFLLLAYVNLHYFKFKAGDMFSKELMEKTEKAQAAISNLLGSQGLEAIDRDLLYDELLQFSEIHQVDVDFFHVDGNLLGSSQRVLYENGILEPRMDGGARHRLLGQGSMLHLQTERIGKLQYLSAYGPVYGADQMLGVVRLPYFTRNMDVKEEQSTVLVALLNFYVIILLVLVLISAFIARGLARPLKTVALQMRATSLTRKNEKISWAHDDEIGQLVKGYNDMVDELERSAKQLALSKKAEAWQEMAKQVAHEIKNPLTPMKLNIQRLMRASKESHPDFEKILEKVGGVIVDQIDQLSKIASEFSTYAQMPMPKKDNTDMEVLVGQIANLYNTDHTVVYFNIAPGPITLCADRDQLFRALNNLVKNGIQSVPQSRLPRIDIVMERIVGPGLRLSVCDNGTGISEVLADKIFFPNFSTKTSGMGMGLSIVKQIVENHNGTIWHEPNPQGGTIFIIEFQAV